MRAPVGGYKPRDFLAPFFFIDRAGGPENSLVLSGSPRSGTTWIMEVLNAHQDHRLVFEPLRPQSVRMVRRLERFTYIRRHNDDPELARLMRRVMSGRYRYFWTDRHNRSFWCTRRLVKLVRGNMLMGYLKQQSPATPIIFIMRHPIAQILSMHKLGYSPFDAKLYLNQPALVEDYLEPYVDRIRSTEGYFENLVLHWCIQNRVALSQCRPDDVHLVFYEELCTDPQTHAERLYQLLGRPIDDRVRRAIRAPSRMANPDSAIVTGATAGEKLISAWRDKATPQQIDTVLEGLRAFELDKIYHDALMPDRQAAEAWLDRPDPARERR